MAPSLSRLVLPESQRRTLSELTEDLDLTSGDSASKRSAFWTMLLLSAVIAAAGILADSTATVIGAMIIAPLSTPIMGMALGVAKREAGATRRAARFVVLGAALVVLVGIAASLVVPGSFDLLGNSQISGRTSPGLVDLVAAIATGFAGAVALARRDVAAVLPGVAIAISLVPPLAVVGVCLCQRDVALALGALVLFLSNLVALVLAGVLVFAALGFGAEAAPDRASRRRAYLAIGVSLVLVLLPLLANTAAAYLVTIWTGRVQTVADRWVTAVPGASVLEVKPVSDQIYVWIQTPGEVPPTRDLLAALRGRIPSNLGVVIVTQVGEQIDVGPVSG